ncbi:hypothetical protein EV182_002046, partial [Spiromyces aspiralis]
VLTKTPVPTELPPKGSSNNGVLSAYYFFRESTALELFRAGRTDEFETPWPSTKSRLELPSLGFEHDQDESGDEQASVSTNLSSVAGTKGGSDGSDVSQTMLTSILVPKTALNKQPFSGASVSPARSNGQAYGNSRGNPEFPTMGHAQQFPNVNGSNSISSGKPPSPGSPVANEGARRAESDISTNGSDESSCVSMEIDNYIESPSLAYVNRRGTSTQAATTQAASPSSLGGGDTTTRSASTPSSTSQDLPSMTSTEWDIVTARESIADVRPNIQAFYKVVQNAKGPKIKITNDVDDAWPPADFVYIDENIWTANVPRPSTDTVIGCECDDCMTDTMCTCCEQNDGMCAYDHKGHVTVPFGHAIYECNHKCKCSSSCPLRVVQHGRKAKLEIFRTQLKGWGVRATEYIPRGRFICEYVGEIITYEEAEKRAKNDQVFGTTYLFDLDYDVMQGDLIDFTIDSRYYGNISHFFNHSCNPNVDIRPVFVEHWDRRLHRLAFFSLRPIHKGDEITFDYNPCHESMQVGQAGAHTAAITTATATTTTGGSGLSKASKNHYDIRQFKCHCESENCRGTIFT